MTIMAIIWNVCLIIFVELLRVKYLMTVMNSVVHCREGASDVLTGQLHVQGHTHTHTSLAGHTNFSHAEVGGLG